MTAPGLVLLGDHPSTFAAIGSTDVLMLVVVLVLFAVSSFLALAETGLTRVSRARASALAEERGRPGRLVARLVNHPERFLTPVLLVVLICQTSAAFLSALVANRVAGGVGVGIALTLNVVLVFVLVQAIPKTWAIRHPDRAALLAARPVAALAAFPPLRLMARVVTGVAPGAANGEASRNDAPVSEEELLALADVAVEEDVIEREERELIESIIELGDTVAREIMVPRPDMVTLGSKSTVTDALDRAIEHGFSRLPVVGETVDDVEGVAYTKDLVRVERSGRGSEPVTVVMRPPHFIPETKQVARLMRQMQEEMFHLAILVDEYGGIAGLVTLEDCLEELVGEIVDEYDAAAAVVEPLAGGGFRVNAGLAIDEVNDLLNTQLPDDDWDTIGGYVFGMVGHVPREGEEVSHEGWRFIADQVKGRRIARVRAIPIPGWTPPEDHDDDGFDE